MQGGVDVLDRCQREPGSLPALAAGGQDLGIGRGQEIGRQVDEAHVAKSWQEMDLHVPFVRLEGAGFELRLDEGEPRTGDPLFQSDRRMFDVGSVF